MDPNFTENSSSRKLSRTSLACSQTLYFVLKVRRARVIKYKPHGMGFILREKRKFSRASRLFSLVDVFEKNEKKNKTTSVYRLVRARQVRRTVGVAGKKNTRAALAFDCTKLCRNIYIPRLVISCGCRVKFSNSS